MYMVFSPYYKYAYLNEDGLGTYEETLYAGMKPRFLNHISDNRFEKEYMFDAAYHLNESGERIYTENIIKELGDN